jgi:hypothetical protein
VSGHIKELEEIGIPRPATTPIFFPLSANLAATADRIQVLGNESSGEVEYALVFTAGRVYVTVASDHTDRGFERNGVQASKQLYPDVVAATVWPYEECRPHWDKLVLRCWTTSQGNTRLYQEATLDELLSAEEWLDRLDREGVKRDGLVFLSGTPPTLGGLAAATTYKIELEDPVLNRTIQHSYEVEVLGPGHQ